MTKDNYTDKKSSDGPPVDSSTQTERGSLTFTNCRATQTAPAARSVFTLSSWYTPAIPAVNSREDIVETVFFANRVTQTGDSRLMVNRPSAAFRNRPRGRGRGRRRVNTNRDEGTNIRQYFEEMAANLDIADAEATRAQAPTKFDLLSLPPLPPAPVRSPLRPPPSRALHPAAMEAESASANVVTAMDSMSLNAQALSPPKMSLSSPKNIFPSVDSSAQVANWSTRAASSLASIDSLAERSPVVDMTRIRNTYRITSNAQVVASLKETSTAVAVSNNGASAVNDAARRPPNYSRNSADESIPNARQTLAFLVGITTPPMQSPTSNDVREAEYRDVPRSKDRPSAIIEQSQTMIPKATAVSARLSENPISLLSIPRESLPRPRATATMSSGNPLVPPPSFTMVPLSSVPKGSPSRLPLPDRTQHILKSPKSFLPDNSKKE